MCRHVEVLCPRKKLLTLALLSFFSTPKSHAPPTRHPTPMSDATATEWVKHLADLEVRGCVRAGEKRGSRHPAARSPPPTPPLSNASRPPPPPSRPPWRTKRSRPRLLRLRHAGLRPRARQPRPQSRVRRPLKPTPRRRSRRIGRVWRKGVCRLSAWVRGEKERVCGGKRGKEGGVDENHAAHTHPTTSASSPPSQRPPLYTLPSRPPLPTWMLAWPSCVPRRPPRARPRQRGRLLLPPALQLPPRPHTRRTQTWRI